MQFLEIAEFYIPGYKLLSSQERARFEATRAGISFSKAVQQGITVVNLRSSMQNYWSRGWQWLTSESEQVKPDLSTKKKVLLSEIEVTEAYQKIRQQIKYRLIEKEFPDFGFLSEKQQTHFLELELCNRLIAVRQALRENEEDYNREISFWQLSPSLIEKLDEKIETLQEQEKQLLLEWCQTSTQEQVFAPFHAAIRLKKAEMLAEKAAGFFPLLNERPTETVPSFKEQLIAVYEREYRRAYPKIALAGGYFMQSLLRSYLERFVAQRISYLNLRDFHETQIGEFIRELNTALDTRQALKLEPWLARYKENLTQQIGKELGLVNGRILQTNQTAGAQELWNSLSYLWKNKAGNFVKKMADAHAFIQSTGFSTQNENSFLAVFDFYNYFQYAENISETKSVFASLLKPFAPLYNEYKEIAFYEKNVFRKVLRTLMPMVVVAGFVVLVAALMTPLAIPELAFLIVAIPTIFFGLYLATQYVNLKNSLYYSLRQTYYGGAFEIPEFQINARMIEAFGNKETAQIVRKVYIDEMRYCDELEASYCEKQDLGCLTENDLNLRNENAQRRRGLALEWYDIHSNVELGCDQVPQIALEQLNQLASKEYVLLQNQLSTNPQTKQEIEGFVNEVTNNLRAILTSSPVANTRPIHAERASETASVVAERALPECLASEENSNQVARPRVITEVTQTFSFTLFKPACLINRERAQYWDSLAQSILDKRRASAVSGLRS